MDIKELTKENVYLIIDTPKKAKKLKNLLGMFGEDVFNPPNHTDSTHNGSAFGWGYGFLGGQWQGFCSTWAGRNGKILKKVSIKELRNILAKEHLRGGDYVVCEEDGDAVVGVFKEWECRFGFEIENCYYLNDKYKDYNSTGGCFDNFKRYATSEEIALIFLKGNWAIPIDYKFAELKEAHKNGATIQCKIDDGSWSDCEPKWNIQFEYRIKPEEKPKVGDVFSVHLKTEKDIQNLLKLSSYERL